MDYIKELLSGLFKVNHEVKGGSNPNSAFLIGLCDNHLESLQKYVCKALEEIKRDYLFIDATEKTFIQFAQEFSKFPFNRAMQASDYIEKFLYDNDRVVIIKCISKLKCSNKASVARGLIKILDDAHFVDNPI